MLLLKTAVFDPSIHSTEEYATMKSMFSVLIFAVCALVIPSLEAIAADGMGTVSVKSIPVSRDLHELRTNDPTKVEKWTGYATKYLERAQNGVGDPITNILFVRMFTAKAGITFADIGTSEKELLALAKSQ